MPAYRNLQQLIENNLKRNSGIHFYFIRHGQSILNLTQAVGGWTDSKLSEKGKLQSKKLQTVLQPHLNSFNSIHTSDLNRCKETLDLALGGCHLKKVNESKKLRELNFGDDEGKLFKSFSEEYRKVINSLEYKAPNGQSWPQARLRAMNYILEIASDGHHFVSTHGGLLVVLLKHVGLKQLVPNCSIISAEFSSKHRQFSKINFCWKNPQQI